jgi:diguanylate cyclase (GGDEF)-like protein
MMEAEFQKKLRLLFAENNQNKFDEINKALKAGDIKLAHRLAHTLKSNAGQIGKTRLQSAAADMEHRLKDGENLVTEEQLKILETELSMVLDEFAPLLKESAARFGTDPGLPLEPKRTRNTLLIVDDEDENLEMLAHILDTDYTVYTAANGENAVERAKEHIPDLILLDILMPGMDGYQTLARLKGHEKLRNIPVIFITGLDSDEDEEKGLALDAADYITKPFSSMIVKLRVRNQIQIINQLRTIERLSMMDQLTELPNRRSLDERLRMEWRQAKREHTPISILMLDVDNFKRFNDIYGHQQGDLVLQIVANILPQSFRRAGDFAARWGGEEFIVLLPNTFLDGALVVAEKIRAAVENTVIPCVDGSTIGLTISIGANSHLPEQGDLTDAFISGADKALYAAKEAGRNRVCHTE